MTVLCPCVHWVVRRVRCAAGEGCVRHRRTASKAMLLNAFVMKGGAMDLLGRATRANAQTSAANTGFACQRVCARVWKGMTGKTAPLLLSNRPRDQEKGKREGTEGKKEAVCRV